MILLFFLIWGKILSAASGLNLNCTNDYSDLMSCRIDAQDCAEHNMTLHNNESTERCSFSPCVTGCCCSIKMILVLGETFSAEVFKRGSRVHSQTIGIRETIKPPTPSIISVRESFGIYQIQWKTNAKPTILKGLKANVTYQKKGDNKKISVPVNPSTVLDLNFYDILRNNLEPSTTYVVSVNTYTRYGVVSDSSKEEVFKTSSSPNGVLIIIVVCLSVIAVLLSGVTFVSYVKLKRKLWDEAATDEKPKLLHIQPKKKEILVPESPDIYSLSVEPLIPKDSLTLSKESLTDSSGSTGQTSGISTGSSSLSYANTEPVDIGAGVLEALSKVFPIISPVSPLSTVWLTESSKDQKTTATDNTPCPVVFVNKSYSILDISHQTQMTCDPGYHSSEGPSLHTSNSPPPSSAVVSTDMSYHPCCKSEENLFLTSCAASSGPTADCQNVLPVIHAYQAFETVAEQSKTLPSENRKEEKILGESQPFIQGFMNNTNNTEVGLSQAEIPQMSLLTANQSNLIVDFGYHCV